MPMTKINHRTYSMSDFGKRLLLLCYVAIRMLQALRCVLLSSRLPIALLSNAVVQALEYFLRTSQQIAQNASIRTF